jgi:hypothetical protein
MAAVRHAGAVDTKMVKTAGEHWVCATLARYGWAPALTRDGLERTDILAVGTHLPHRPTIEVQVKTASQRGETTNWPLGAKAQLFAESDLEWFALVLLPELPRTPRAFIVPRDHLSAATWIVHQEWLHRSVSTCRIQECQPGSGANPLDDMARLCGSLGSAGHAHARSPGPPAATSSRTSPRRTRRPATRPPLE